MTYTFGQTSPRLISEEELPASTLVLNIGKSLDDYIRRYNLPEDFPFTPAHIMSFTQRAWKLSKEHANSAELILAVSNVAGLGKLILGAFVFGRINKEDNADKFIFSEYPGDEKRLVFLAEPALPAVWSKFVGNYLDPQKKGEANPVRYYE